MLRVRATALIGALVLAAAASGAPRPARPAPRRPALSARPLLRVTASSFEDPTATPSAPDLVTLVAAPGGHALAEIAVSYSDRGPPQAPSLRRGGCSTGAGSAVPALALGGVARSGGSVLPLTAFELAPQAETAALSGSARYWLSVQIPSEAKPGLYRLPLRLVAGPASRALSIAINVLPFPLSSASRRYVIHFQGSTARQGAGGRGSGVGGRVLGGGTACPVPITDHPTPDTRPPTPATELRTRLLRLRSRDIGTVGFDRPDAELAAALDSERALRFHGPYPRSLEPGAQDAAERVAAAARAWSGRSTTGLLWVVPAGAAVPPAVRAAIHESGGSLAVVLDATGGAGAVEGADILIHPLSAADAGALLAGGGSGGRPAGMGMRRPQWLTWDPAAVTPLQNRLYAGFLLWRSGLSGAYWRAEDTEQFWRPHSPGFRTLEALGAGIEDARYLTELYALLRQVRDKDRHNPLPDRAEVKLHAALHALSPASSAAEVAAARRTLIAAIRALQAVVE